MFAKALGAGFAWAPLAFVQKKAPPLLGRLSGIPASCSALQCPAGPALSVLELDCARGSGRLKGAREGHPDFDISSVSIC